LASGTEKPTTAPEMANSEHAGQSAGSAEHD
jgi:hypothetical protein